MMQNQLTEVPKERHVAAQREPVKTRKRLRVGLRPTVVRSRPCTNQPRRGCILAAVDFTESSRNALTHARDLATRLGCRLVLLHVIRRSCGQGLPWASRERTASIKAHFEAMQQLEAMVPHGEAALQTVTCIVRHGLPEYEILRAAEELQPDLLILGHGPQNLFYRTLFDSLVRDVIDCASCPVLVVNE